MTGADWLVAVAALATVPVIVVLERLAARLPRRPFHSDASDLGD